MTEDQQPASAPQLLLCGHLPLLADAAAALGWRIAHDPAPGGIHLVIVAGDASETVRSLPTVPLVVVGAAAAPALDADDALRASSSRAEAEALLARWRPDPPEALARIEAALGAAAVRDMLLRLQAQLEGAISCVGDDTVRLAHRLGGIAGMLGFAALGRAWLDVEEGVPGARRAARTETRRALAVIARRLG